MCKLGESCCGILFIGLLSEKICQYTKKRILNCYVKGGFCNANNHPSAGFRPVKKIQQGFFSHPACPDRGSCNEMVRQLNLATEKMQSTGAS